MRNADEALVYLNKPSNIIVEGKGVKTVLIGCSGNETARMTVMLSVLADGCKLLLHVVL
jgi:hypothetical protein